MKTKIINLIIVSFGSLFFLSCEIHDPIAELSRPGNFAANVYWDIPNTVVNAGSNVPFYSEYWSVDGKIEYLGVYYDLVRKISYSITYFGNGYTFSFDSTAIAREFQEITKYQHSASFYNPEKKAFVFENVFPVSYTLSGFEERNPVTFNLAQVNLLYPPNIQNRFYEGVFTTLTYNDLNTILVINNQLISAVDFETHFDVIVDPGTQQVKKNVKPTSVATLKGLLKQVPLSSLVFNPNRQYFGVIFSRSYELNARLRVVNGNQIENFSDSKKITIL